MYYYFIKFSNGGFLRTDHTSPEDWAEFASIGVYPVYWEIRYKED